MENDYKDKAGVPHANKLKDLARLTLRFTLPAKLAQALRELHTLGFKITILKVALRVPAARGLILLIAVTGVVLTPSRVGLLAEQVCQPNAAWLLCAHRTLPRWTPAVICVSRCGLTPKDFVARAQAMSTLS